MPYDFQAQEECGKVDLCQVWAKKNATDWKSYIQALSIRLALNFYS